jgi:hypothetical protein
MKYLSLDNSEFRELLQVKRVSFIIYLVASIIFALISYLVLDKIIAGRALISTLSIVLFLAGASLIIFIYSNRDYFLDLIKKEKKVFKGVLSSKTARKNYYVFNMDGNGFVVDKETFDNCNEGDIVEFHTSPLSKYLFKVEKVSEAV